MTDYLFLFLLLVEIEIELAKDDYHKLKSRFQWPLR